MSGVAGEEEEADQDDQGPVLGLARSGGVGGGGARLGQGGDQFEAGGEQRTKHNWDGHYYYPDDQSSAVILIPNVTESDIFLSYNSTNGKNSTLVYIQNHDCIFIKDSHHGLKWPRAFKLKFWIN